ncbi:MAG: hypothetical protein A2Y77_10090 [Planctomycetes bacterium RBG_13_62_9]|nr:MAG: hypothetical protein A2Y77_10090 [Planctomycetes bacterium RBG_13_62_9]
MDTTDAAEKPVPTRSPYVFGIDLGTCNSVIAVSMRGVTEAIPIEAYPSCPSVVCVRDDGDVKVGRAAKSLLLMEPENTVDSIKREMGTEWTKQFRGRPDQIYTPADISAEILSKLVAGAEESGKDLMGTPHYVVGCVPANFNDAQKRATEQAIELANIEKLWLLEEPTAAALAYAVDKEVVDQTILVYDLGGGTFDVAVLKVTSTKEEGDHHSAKFDFLAKEGVPRLGGDDFDRKIMEMAAAKLLEESKIDILDTAKDQGISQRAIREAQQRLKEVAEAAKMELSEAESATITISNLIKDESGTMHSLDMEITRAQFDDAIREMLMQSKDAVERALAAAKITIADISRIILVGGSTRIPLVKTMLKEMFGKEPWGDTNPDTVVARGAAIYGATLNDPEEKKWFTIHNIVSHHLGMEAAGGRFVRLLEKGAEIPAEAPLTATKEFTNPRDNMTELRFSVYQSDREAQFVRSEGVECVGEFFLKGLPPRPAGQTHVDVTFQIDQQNLLTVTAESDVSGELKIARS